MKKKVKATLAELVSVSINARSHKDQRKKVDRYVYSYYYNNAEYRRGYEVKRGQECIPEKEIEVLP